MSVVAQRYTFVNVVRQSRGQVKPRTNYRRIAMKRELRGVQVTCKAGVYYLHEIESITIDCHLGSLILTKDELLNYLENRNSQEVEPRD